MTDMSDVTKTVEVGRFWPFLIAWVDGWLACEFPERPYEWGATGFHDPDHCHACAVAADAAYRQSDDAIRARLAPYWDSATWQWMTAARIGR